MKKIVLFWAWILCASTLFAERRVEYLPYGNMDTWTVRHIKESGLLGGATKVLHAVGPNDTIRENKAYEPVAGNPWACSETYAKVIVEAGAGGAVIPERRGNGYCCRLENKMTHVKIGDIYAVVTGAIFLGKKYEPVGLIGKYRPHTVIDVGIPFTKQPVALMLDYKAVISDSCYITSTARDKPVRVDGEHDCGEIYIYLQHRWEDPETGEIYARRVGTACERVCETIPEWVNNHEIPVRYGNITTDPNFKPYEAIGYTMMMTRNSKGKMVQIQEVGYSLDKPTHIVLMIASGCSGAFRAHEGNKLWVDNIRLVYDDEEHPAKTSAKKH